MTKMEIAKQVLSVAGGVAKTADFLNAGLTKSDVCTFTNDGFLKTHSVTATISLPIIPHFTERLIASLIPKELYV
jgi:hypothetical protein